MLSVITIEKISDIITEHVYSDEFCGKYEINGVPRAAEAILEAHKQEVAALRAQIDRLERLVNERA